MAGMYSNYCKMIALGFLQFMVLSSTLDAIWNIVEAGDVHSQAFIQTDNELRYLVDGVSIHLHESLTSGNSHISFTDVDDDSLHTYASPIRFEPPFLDFREHPVGMPLMEKVAVINPSGETSIHMLSISGSTTDFHCSFFKEKSIPPGGNTTFDVVFLGRQEGAVENTLFIHTSLGSFKYQVKAVGVSNPYRLRPFLGVRMPLNSSYTPIIQMHNPYSSTLQVTEMYSSGGDLHLELPTGEVEASQQMWEIPPFETKSVMRANFIARTESNHTAYIRIKTNSSNNDNLILPMEVEVSSAPGIYSPTEVLDFGVMRSHDEVKTLSLNLINYGQKHIHIQNVIITPVNEAITVEFQPVRVPPDTLHATHVASVSFNPGKASHLKQHSGKIVVKSKNTQFKLTIPYQVTLLLGSLVYNSNITKFYLDDKAPQKSVFRNFSVTNTFNVSVVVHNIAVAEDIEEFVKIHDFNTQVLAPGETITLMQLEMDSAKAASITSLLRLFTNISFFDVPIVCYDGRLKKFALPAMDKEKLDFGTVSIGEKRDMFFVLVNENPVDIYLKRWGSNISRSFVELVGVDKGNTTSIMLKQNISGLPRSLIIRPNHYAILRLGLVAPEKQGPLAGEVFIETFYESMKIPVNLWSVKGSLNSDVIVFEDAFPGKISWKTLQIHSTFSQAMTVTSVEAFPIDERLTFEPLKTTLPILKPETKSLVGKLYFDPTKNCGSHCYTGLPADLGKRWMSGMSMAAGVGDVDSDLYHKMRNMWNDLVNSGKQSVNMTVQLHTNEVKGFYLKAQVHFHWPRLANKHKIKFPVTQIGNVTIREFALENPSGLPVIAQVLLLPMYPGARAMLDALQIKLPDNVIDSLETEDLETFTLRDTEQYNQQPDNPIPSYRSSIQDFFRVQPFQQSIALLLTPGMRVRIRIGFAPKDESLRSTVVLIRNNLTVMDTVIIQGQGGFGQLKFGNKKPGTLTPLLFEMTDKHLKDCDKIKASKHLLPNFTVKRAFTARNPGELPVYVRDFAVNGSPCEGFGFKVLNCQSFELLPNASRKIDIAFTPDFTMSRVQRILNIVTSLSPGGMMLNYSLVATIPPHLVAQCSNAIPRPEWEPLLYYSAFSFMAFLMFCVLVMAYFESERVFKYRFIRMTTCAVPSSEQSYERSKVFDLRNMVFRNAEFRSSCHSEGSRERENSCNRKHKDSSTSTSTVLCSNLLNFTPNLFKSKKGNHWPNSSKTPVETTTHSSRDKDVCNNYITPAKDFESSEADHNTGHNNKFGNRRKSGKRLSVSESHNYDSTTPSSSEKSRLMAFRGWSSLFNSNGGNRKTVHATDSNNVKHSKEKDAKHNQNTVYDQRSNENEVDKGGNKSKVHCRARSPPKQDYHESKPVRKGKVQELHEEDTSSTTTESSNTDVELTDKGHCQETVPPSSKPVKTKNWKLKSKVTESEKTTKTTEPHEIDDDGEFELSTKSRAHRRVKVDHSKVYGGDILRPNTLELPYKLKTVGPSKEERDLKGVSRTKKVQPTLKTKASLRVASEVDGPKGKDSPPPEWDHPKPFVTPGEMNIDEAFTELSKQTEIFAQKHGRLPACPALERPSSYSAIVSDGNKAKAFSLSNTTLEPKKTEYKHPGTIGQRTPSQSSASSSTLSRPWGPTLLSPATPQTPEASMLFPGVLLHEPMSNGFLPVDDGLDTNKDCTSNPSFPPFGNPEPFSLDRLWEPRPFNSEQCAWREETPDVRKGKDWSGFGMDLLNSNSLWDASYNPNPVDTWMTSDSLNFSPPSNGSNFESHLGPPSSPWPTSVWSNAVGSKVGSPAVSSVSSSSCGGETLQLSSTSTESKLQSDGENGNDASVPGFNPFRTPHHIWSPANQAHLGHGNDAPNSWSFSFFSNNKEPAN